MTAPTLTAPAVDATRARRRRQPMLVAGLILLAVLILIAIFAPLFLSEAANTLTSERRQPPSPQHWLGTDEFGRDLLARSLVATQITLILTAIASVISVTGGILLGVGAWFLPAPARRILIGWNGIIVAFPSMIIALIAAVILGAGAFQAALAVGIAGIPSFTRLSHNIAAQVVERDFIRAARDVGVSLPRVMGRHVLPNIAEPLLILATGHVIIVLMELSGLSFLGLGVQAPQYDYGKLLADGLTAIFSQPTEIAGPAIMLILTGLAATLIGDGLAARANPTTTRATRGSRRTDPLTLPASTPTPDAATYVNVRDLRIDDGQGKELVKGVDLSIRRGEILGLVGESGSGKSLTAMALAGLLPDGVRFRAQALQVGELDMRTSGQPAAKAREIGLVFQDPMSAFNPVYSIGTQLTEVARTHLGMSGSLARETLVTMMDALGIQDPARRVRQYAHELSGGMLQRSVISSALVTRAKLLIADEPTSALDVRAQLAVVREFVRARRDLDASMLFISHDMALVRDVCDRVIVMKDGGIVEEVSPEQIDRRDVTAPYTKRLLEASAFVERITTS